MHNGNYIISYYYVYINIIVLLYWIKTNRRFFLIVCSTYQYAIVCTTLFAIID